jgi:hypothetical protein
MSDFIKQVAKIQRDLKAPKNQYNSFGKYKFRSCEDILEGLKPLLGDLVLTVGDDVVLVGNRIYVKATATITNGKESLSNSALAREAENKKGMDDSQITGTASSYARKYALNGLFCIDDSKDADRNEPTQDDMSWVNAIKNKQTTLEEIIDPDYRSYIEKLLKENK